MALKFPSLVGKDAITDKKILIGAGVCFTGGHDRLRVPREAGIMSATIALLLGGMGWAMIWSPPVCPSASMTASAWTTPRSRTSSSGAQTRSERSSWSVGSSTPSDTCSTYDLGSEEIMGVLYNIADMISKIGFGIVAWIGAKKATEALAN